MSTIGTFAKAGEKYTGSIHTLSIEARAEIVPIEAKTERSPDFRVYVGGLEIGAAWHETARESQRPYISVALDDPSFPAPVNASLFESDRAPGHFRLVWDRKPKD